MKYLKQLYIWLKHIFCPMPTNKEIMDLLEEKAKEILTEYIEKVFTDKDYIKLLKKSNIDIEGLVKNTLIEERCLTFDFLHRKYKIEGTPHVRKKLVLFKTTYRIPTDSSANIEIEKSLTAQLTIKENSISPLKEENLQISFLSSPTITCPSFTSFAEEYAKKFWESLEHRESEEIVKYTPGGQE